MSEFSQNIDATKADDVSDAIEKLAVSGGEDIPDAPEKEGGDDSPVIERKPGPAERLLYPKDVIDVNDDDEMVYVIGTKDGKVTRIEGLENMRKIKQLVLRCCLVSGMEGIETLDTLTKLELYDNQIERISCIERLQSLVVLDISFNSIRDMSPVAVLPLLEELYIAQNKLRKISGLEGMQHLRILDLGANRIRVSLTELIFCIVLFPCAPLLFCLYCHTDCLIVGDGWLADPHLP